MKGVSVMSYPIIIKKEIANFLEEHGAVKIYEKFHQHLAFLCRLEAWLKGDTFVTVETQMKSDIVEKIVLYHAGDEKVKKFWFYGKSRALLSEFYASVHHMEEGAASLFPATPWKPYCEIFGTEDCHGKILNDAKNVLDVLKDLDKELRKRFCSVEELLTSMLSENAKLKIDLRPGDLLKNGDGKFYWFLGTKDKVGNYLLLNEDSHLFAFDYGTFKDWQKVDTLSMLKETLRRFYTLFDPAFIETVLKPVTEVSDHFPVDSATIKHNCAPFSQWVEQKDVITVSEDVVGQKYRFETENQIEVSISVDSISCIIFLYAISDNSVKDSERYREEFFNPFLHWVSSYGEGISCILKIFNEIYGRFSREIAELDLSTAFIELYKMWEQILTSVKDFDKNTNEELLNSLLTEFKDTASGSTSSTTE